MSTDEIALHLARRLHCADRPGSVAWLQANSDLMALARTDMDAAAAKAAELAFPIVRAYVDALATERRAA